MEIHPKVLEHLRTIDLTSNDNRQTFNQEARLAYWFHTFMHDDLLESGRQLTGYVFRQSERQCLLVVKATCEGTQDVVFCTERTPVGCMFVFCRKFFAESLEWRKDRYV